jgi:chromosome segregation ATPase
MSKESQERYNLQLQSVTSSVEAANRRFEKAEQDLAQTKTQLENANAALATVKGENKRDRSRLEELRNQFQQLLTENTQMVEKALQAQQAESPSGRAPTISR